MASFKQHLNIAVVATGMVVVPLHASGVLTTYHSVLALFLGVVGGILPDLDSDSSKPVQITFEILSIFLPLFILLLTVGKLPLLKTVLLWIILTIVLRLTLFNILLKLTTHRGLFHSVPMGFFIFEILALIFYEVFHYSMHYGVLVSFFVFYGFLVHLILDEVYSVNLEGMRLKKSFGTAFKFYDKNNLKGSFILYLFIVVAYFLTPLKNADFLGVINLLKPLFSFENII